jgi:hypothetical protein
MSCEEAESEFEEAMREWVSLSRAYRRHARNPGGIRAADEIGRRMQFAFDRVEEARWQRDYMRERHTRKSGELQP